MRAPVPYSTAIAGDAKALAHTFGLPQYILRRWQLEGLISRSVITVTEWEALDLVRRGVWDNRAVLRAMLRGLPVDERRRIIDTCVKTAIERIVYNDFLRFKLSGTGIMGDGRPVTYGRYEQYLSWRHPGLCLLLSRQVFDRQRKAALAKIAYAKKTGTYKQLKQDMFCRKEDDAVKPKK